MKKLTFLFLIGISSLLSQTAVFPTGVAADQQLGVAANNVTGLLNNSVQVSDTSLNIKNGTCTANGISTTCNVAYKVNMFITINSEIMRICSLGSATGVTVLNLGSVTVGSSCPSISGRGLDGTQIAAHSTITANACNSTLTGCVRNIIVAWNINALVKEVEAIEQNSTAVININKFSGVDPTGATDSTTGIMTAIAAAQSVNKTLYCNGTYKHAGISWTGGLSLLGNPVNQCFFNYTGTGSGVTLTTPAGNVDNVVFKSTGNATNLVDIVGGTEIFFNRVYYGGSTSTAATNCLRLRGSGGYFDQNTFSGCASSVLLDTYASANFSVHISNSNIFQASTAGINILDTGDLFIDHNQFEAVQNGILFDNTSSSVIASGVISIRNNHFLLLGTSNGHTFTNPLFINAFGNNASNSMVLDTIHSEGNSVQSANTSYCVNLAKSTSAGGSWNFIFNRNSWNFGCGTSAIVGDLSTIYVQSFDEHPEVAQPEFSGTLTGTYKDINGLQSYSSGSLHPLQIAPIFHSVSPFITAGDCGTSPILFAGANDRYFIVQVGTGAVTSCKVKFGTSFVAQPPGVIAMAFNAGSSVLTGFPGLVSYIQITGTALQGSTFVWIAPLGN